MAPPFVTHIIAWMQSVLFIVMEMYAPRFWVHIQLANYDSRNFICHLCFGVYPVFPKILTLLNINNPIGIHVRNAWGFTSVCRLRLCLGRDQSLAGKKYSFITDTV